MKTLCKLLLLAGNSVENRSWIQEVADFVKSDFEKIYIAEYDHWNSEGSITIATEKKKLKKDIGEWDNFIVFGKSAGSILALDSINSGIIKPLASLFVGFPYHFAKKIESNPEDLLGDCTVPVHIVQQNYDPAIYYEELKGILEKINNTKISIEAIEGDSHHYGDLSLIRDRLLKL